MVAAVEVEVVEDEEDEVEAVVEEGAGADGEQTDTSMD